VLVASPLWAPDYLKERIANPSEQEEEAASAADLDNASQLRIDTWRAIMKVVTEHPIDGVGFNGLSYVLPETGEELGIEVKDTSHNTFLRFLGEMGIFGLGIFLVLLWKCFRLGLDATRLAISRFDRQLALGFTGATIAMAVSCAFGDRFFSVIIAGSYWMTCALV